MPFPQKPVKVRAYGEHQGPSLIAPYDLDLENPRCPLCALPMVMRSSAYGGFWGCQQFPKCGGKRKLRIWEDDGSSVQEV